MSVEYKSALIYGYDCSKIQDEWPHEALEKMEELGYDVISDCYSDKFLYIGKIISHVDCYKEARVDCLASEDQARIDLKCLLAETPWEYTKHLPLYKSMYHICYAI